VLTLSRVAFVVVKMAGCAFLFAASVAAGLAAKHLKRILFLQYKRNNAD